MTRKNPSRFTSTRLFFATLFVAIYLASTGASAQILSKGLATTGAPTAVVKTEQVRAELLPLAPDGVALGKTVWVGLQISHQPHWHTYWKNPGDSGLATVLNWTLPQGVTAGEIDWPTPHRITIGKLANFGFEDTVLLPVPLTIAPGFQPPADGVLDIRLSASWLVCRQECIPQEGNFALRLPTQESTGIHTAVFAASKAASPQNFAGQAQMRIDGDGLLMRVTGLPAAWQGRALTAFPETSNVAEPSNGPQSADTVASASATPAVGQQVWTDGVWSGRFAFSVQRETAPTTLPVVLVLGSDAQRTVAPIEGTWPALAENTTIPYSAANPSTANESATSPLLGLGVGGAILQRSAAWATLAMALAAAVLGGMILNLMPCVLPVLAIKVLSFSQHGGHSRGAQRAQGLAYTLGVVVSFVALGALMLALRATGEQLGWGFHLQSPGVVAALAVLFMLLGLNLAGMFEIGNLLPNSLASLQVRHPVVDAFLSGVLAVAIASPCTAPFMGASLGYAISLPAYQALAIFAALGLGLALPFLLASWVPSVGKLLPRPGAWMDTLRRFLAFPMFATVVWMVWVLGHLSGVDGAGALLALLLAVGLVVWSLGLKGRSRTGFAIFSIAALLALTGAVGQFVINPDESTNTASAAQPGGEKEGTTHWQAWTPGKVEAELAAGRPVFVDFTAAWCITCQYNKKNTLANAAVLADFRTHGVTLLRADWTRRDPAITQALEKLGRSGVPVYVLHQAKRAPVVFSEILDTQDLRTSLAQLATTSPQ